MVCPRRRDDVGSFRPWYFHARQLGVSFRRPGKRPDISQAGKPLSSLSLDRSWHWGRICCEEVKHGVALTVTISTLFSRVHACALGQTELHSIWDTDLSCSQHECGSMLGGLVIICAVGDQVQETDEMWRKSQVSFWQTFPEGIPFPRIELSKTFSQLLQQLASVALHFSAGQRLPHFSSPLRGMV